MSKSALSQAVDMQAGTPASLKWVCNRVIDPVGKSCKYFFNYGTCDFISDSVYCELLESPLDGYLFDYYNDARSSLTDQNNSAAYVEAGLQPLLNAYPALANFTRLTSQVAKEANSTEDDVMNVFGTVYLPSFTEDLLTTACAAPVAMLVVDALPLQYEATERLGRTSIITQLVEAGLPFFGSRVR